MSFAAPSVVPSLEKGKAAGLIAVASAQVSPAAAAGEIVGTPATALTVWENGRTTPNQSAPARATVMIIREEIDKKRRDGN